MRTGTKGIDDHGPDVSSPRHHGEMPAGGVACLAGAFVFGLVATGSFASGDGPTSVILAAVAIMLVSVYLQVWGEGGTLPPRKRSLRGALTFNLMFQIPLLGMLLAFCGLVGWIPPTSLPGCFLVTYVMTFISPVAGSWIASTQER